MFLLAIARFDSYRVDVICRIGDMSRNEAFSARRTHNLNLGASTDICMLCAEWATEIKQLLSQHLHLKPSLRTYPSPELQPPCEPPLPLFPLISGCTSPGVMFIVFFLTGPLLGQPRSASVLRYIKFGCLGLTYTRICSCFPV